MTDNLSEITWLQRCAGKVVKSGRIPGHIAFILDGNRRNAKAKGIDNIESYEIGYQRMIQSIYWCQIMGVKEVSLYVFSVENFKRPEKEVKFLFKLARRFSNSAISRSGQRLHMQGDLTLLPVFDQICGARGQLGTMAYETIKVNCCFSYTSRHEIAQVSTAIVGAIRDGDLKMKQINSTTIDKILGAGPWNGSEPDIYIRTSGETRLSDYLLWQSGHSTLHNININWPDFNWWYFLGALISYQVNYDRISEGRQTYKAKMTVGKCDKESEDEMKDFLHQKSKEHVQTLKNVLVKGYIYRRPIPPSE